MFPVYEMVGALAFLRDQCVYRTYSPFYPVRFAKFLSLPVTLIIGIYIHAFLAGDERRALVKDQRHLPLTSLFS